MAKTPTKPKAAAAAKLPVENTGISQEDVSKTAMDASGSTGSSETNTGAADKTVSVSGQKQTVDAHDQTGVASAAASVALSDASQGDAAGGAGANASSDLLPFGLDDVLVASGASTTADLLHFADVGQRVLLSIEELSGEYPALQKWLGSEDPAGIVRELAENYADLEELLERRTLTVALPERRTFAIIRDVRLDNILFETGDMPDLTKTQHADVVAANACVMEWEDGATA